MHSSHHPSPLRSRRRILLAALVPALAALSGATAPASAQSCTTQAVNAPAGPVCGTTDSVTVADTLVTATVFRGIPYALPPVDSLRWQAPRPVPAWTAPLQATAFGPMCPQMAAETVAGAEDCLYLNVWAPTDATSGSNLPVMVFIHGGAFLNGAGSVPLYNGSYLASSGDVVVVTLNYRLGALGFLAAAAGDAGRTVGGNFGLLDQKMALQWVQQNIAAFGGDPAQVTLFGESAGAMSVGFHLFSLPASQSLFRAAIMESNPMGFVYRNTAEAQSDGAMFINTLCTAAGGSGCDSTWLATVSLESILTAQTQFETTGLITRLEQGGLPEALPWTPVVDGDTVTGQPNQGYATGVSIEKPYIFGMNEDEGVLFAALAQHADSLLLNFTTYPSVLSYFFGSEQKTIRENSEYQALSQPSSEYLDPTASALSQVIRDFAFNCGNLAAADSAYRSQREGPPIYGYQFRQPPAFDLYFPIEACTVEAGNVCHGNELPYVFNTLSYVAQMDADTAASGAALAGDTSHVTSYDAQLAAAMAAAWVSFAQNPNQPPLANWTPYTTDGSLYAWQNTASATSGSVSGLANSANCTSLWYGIQPVTGTSGALLPGAAEAGRLLHRLPRREPRRD